MTTPPLQDAARMALSDAAIDKAVEAWFTTRPAVVDDEAAFRERMRAALRAALAASEARAEPAAPRAFRIPEPGVPWWQTAKDCGAWTDRSEGDVGYVHFGSTEALRVYTVKVTQQALKATHSAAPQQPPVSLLWQVRKALARAAAICDAVPNRQDGHLGALVNPQPDGTHGYREIHEAEAALVAYLTTPEAAPQQPAPAEPIGCLCGPDFWLMSASGGAAPEGLCGRLTMHVDGKAQDYVKAGPPRDLLTEAPAERGECLLPAQRESVEDALMIVESYGPWGADLNDAHRRQIVLADEVLRLRRIVAAIGSAVTLAGCVDMVQPPDVALADELCAKRGGYAHVQRWERGAVLDVTCKDGTQLNVRLPKKA